MDMFPTAVAFDDLNDREMTMMIVHENDANEIFSQRFPNCGVAYKGWSDCPIATICKRLYLKMERNVKKKRYKSKPTGLEVT